jgi:hypothetical protein
VSDLTFHDFLEDALASLGPDLDQMITIVEVFQPLVEDLNLKDREVLSLGGYWVIGAVRLDTEKSQIYISGYRTDSYYFGG